MKSSPEGVPQNLFPSRFDHNSFIDSAAEFTLPHIALERTASWSSRDNKPVTLRELIASRFPAAAQKLGIQSLDTTAEQVKRVGELIEEELKEVACAQLTSGTERSNLWIEGQSYTPDELVKHVRAGTGVGHRIVTNRRRSMFVLEKLIEKGKLIGISDEPPAPIRLPDFDF